MTDPDGPVPNPNLITGWPSLLAATKCASVEEFQDWVIDNLDADYPDLIVDPNVGNGPTYFTHHLGRTLEFPFTTQQLWDSLRELDNWLDGYYRAEELPQYFDDQPEQEDATPALAAFFDVPSPLFVVSAGAGWYAIDPEGRVGLSEIPRHWFAAGAPAQVLLGIGEEYAAIGTPILVPAGFLGPGRLDAADVVEVELRTPDSLQRTGAAIREAEAQRRAASVFCNACRQLKAPEDIAGADEGFCYECAQAYLGIIFD